MPGCQGQVIWGANLDFTDPTSNNFTHPGGFTAAGDLAIGTGTAPPGQQIAVGTLTGSGGIVISYVAPDINIDGAAAGTATTYQADAGTATPAAYILNVLGAGTVSTSAAGNTLTITGTGGGITWSNISANQTLVVNNGYFCSAGAALSLALPAVSAVGDIIEVVLIGSTSYTVTQSAGQSIRLGSVSTTAGVGGSLASTQQGDAIRLICQQANLTWVIGAGAIGNLTIV